MAAIKTRKKKALTPPEIDLSDTERYLSIGHNDLNLYFSDTFLKIGLPEKEDFTWGMVKSFFTENDVDTKDKSKIFVDLLLDKTSAKKTRFRLSDISVDFSFPSVGLYNYRNSAVFIFRKNFRQNKKGLCPDTLTCVPVTNLYSRFIPFSTGFAMKNMWRWTINNLNQVFLKSEYMEFVDALERINKYKCLAKALSLNFLLGQGLTDKNPSLWFRKTLIGSALNYHEVMVNNPLFLQEAIDFFQPQGVTVTNGHTTH